MPLTRLRAADLWDEALAGILARPARASLTVLGVLLGVASFTAVLGLTTTASGQISARFDALMATEVLVETLVEEDAGTVDPHPSPLPADAEERLSRLNGVTAAGVYWTALSNGGATAGQPGPGVRAEPVDVRAVTPGYFEAVNATVASGRFFDDFHHTERQRVAVLGRAAAQRLGITDLRYQPAVFVDGTPLTVVGIVDQVDRHPEVLMTVLVPAGAAESMWGHSTSLHNAHRALIDTELGAAGQVAAEAPYALRPEHPESLRVTAPPDPRDLRENVATDLGVLFLALAGICLVIGTVGIANTTLVSVLERVPEIGLRRALGARRRHVASHFLTESALLGLLGGLVGTALGVVVVVGIAVAREWTPILEPLTVLPSPLVGALTGLIAGAYPAWRATRIEPAEALRR